MKHANLLGTALVAMALCGVEAYAQGPLTPAVVDNPPASLEYTCECQCYTPGGNNLINPNIESIYYEFTMSSVSAKYAAALCELYDGNACEGMKPGLPGLPFPWHGRLGSCSISNVTI